MVKELVASIPLFWLKVIMWGVSFVLLVFRDYVAELHRGTNPHLVWFWVPFLCLVGVEVLNQVTFYLFKSDRRKAVLIKAIAFWALFLFYITSDIAIRLQATRTGVWDFQEKWSDLLLLFLLSTILPWYSFCTDIRFFILHGRFIRENKVSPIESSKSSCG
jgi:hypothetical protein